MKKSNGKRSSKRQGIQHPKTQGGKSRSGKRIMIVWVLIGVAVISVGVLVVWRMNTSGDAPSLSTGEDAQEAAQTPAASTRPVELQKLIGRWVRMDTPYVIEILKVNEDGTLQAGYYNPRSINVSVAKVENKNGKLEVFVELRDTNYPGSTYRLIYDRATEMLRGVYFQAVMKQNYDVAFRRVQTR
ncbi:MAG: hypothetical protein ACYS67_08315 [Planctomycetota bacterium]|jgi:hypothetical protein